MKQQILVGLQESLAVHQALASDDALQARLAELAAVDVSAKARVRTMGFTGKSGGKLVALCPCLHVPSTRTERIQEGHVLLGHILCGLLETIQFKAP